MRLWIVELGCLAPLAMLLLVVFAVRQAARRFRVHVLLEEERPLIWIEEILTDDR